MMGGPLKRIQWGMMDQQIIWFETHVKHSHLLGGFDAPIADGKWKDWSS